MIKHVLYGLRNAVIGFIAGLALLYGVQAIWWQYGPYDTATVFEPIGVLNNLDQVEPGGELKLFLSFNKATDVAPRVDRNVVCASGNTYQVNAPNASSSRPSGQFTATLNFTMPDNLIVGDVCIFQFQNSYQVNPIRTINKVWVSEKFTVIERK